MKRDPEALQDREHDVLVIGGGIAGAWVAREASSRGLKTALVELEDFGQGTSWSSLKTAHGGLRHLQRFDLAGFRESVRERRALLRVAPEVVRPLSFAIPTRGLAEQVKFLLAGLANDVLAYDRNEGLRTDRWIGASRVIGSAEAASLGAAAFSSAGAFVWQDAQITHTERLLMGLLHAASEASTVVINRCRIEACVRTSRGFELKATDLPSGREVSIRARTIVNAAGAQLETVANLLGETCASPPLIRGVNVVLSRDLTPGLAVGGRDRGRFLFLVPWLGRSMLGTIYDDGRRPEGDLIRELVEAGGRAFPWAGVHGDDVTAVQAGHVPGAPNGEPIYRSRLIAHGDPRLLSILTAKYTTARGTAESTVDRIGQALSISLPSSVSARQDLKMARPLSGPLEDRIRWVEDTEMALSRADAVRGRLIEGAFGSKVDSRASQA